MASMLSDSSLNFKYSTLEKATGSFDIANKLGQGGFGTVYKVSTDTCMCRGKHFSETTVQECTHTVHLVSVQVFLYPMKMD